MINLQNKDLKRLLKNAGKKNEDSLSGVFEKKRDGSQKTIKGSN